MSASRLQILRAGMICLFISLLLWPSFLFYGPRLWMIFEVVRPIAWSVGWFLIATTCAMGESRSLIFAGRICQIVVSVLLPLTMWFRWFANGEADIAPWALHVVRVGWSIELLSCGLVATLLMRYNLSRLLQAIFAVYVLLGAASTLVFPLLTPMSYAANSILIVGFIAAAGFIAALWSLGWRTHFELRRRKTPREME
jgi:hypothetical protein